MSLTDSSSSSEAEEVSNQTFVERVHFYVHENCNFQFFEKILNFGYLSHPIEELRIPAQAQIVRVNKKDCRGLNRYVIMHYWGFSDPTKNS